MRANVTCSSFETSVNHMDVSLKCVLRCEAMSANSPDHTRAVDGAVTICRALRDLSLSFWCVYSHIPPQH